MLSPAVKNTALVLMAITLFLTPFFASDQWVKALNLLMDSRKCEGTITAIHRTQPTKLFYRFQLNQQTYEGMNEGVFIGHRRPGESVTVYYAPNNPLLSSVTRPELFIQEQSSGILYSAVTATFFLIWGFMNRQKQTQQLHSKPITGKAPQKLPLSNRLRRLIDRGLNLKRFRRRSSPAPTLAKPE